MTATALATELTAPAARRRWALPDRPGLVALLLGVLGVGYRLWLTAAPTPLTNSDEATMGLAALHIARGTDWPVFFYGQDYMGVLEAYAAAPLFWLFGPSVAGLRLPVLVSYALFLWLAYRLTRLLYRPWFAVLVVGLLAGGADRVVKDQLIAAGGYPELLPLGTGLLLLSVLLGAGLVRHRLLGFAGWGLLAGLLIWIDWLILPYLLAAGLLLVFTSARELIGRRGLALLGGVLLGALPLLLAAAAHPDHSALRAYLNASGGGPRALPDRVHGVIGLGIPLATGVCQPSHCGPAQVAYGYGFLVLVLVAAGLAVVGLRRARRTSGGGGPVPARLRQLARLCLAGAALLTILLYVRSASAAGTPIESARYLACLQISLGAVLWPLWLVARRLFPTAGAAGAAPARPGVPGAGASRPGGLRAVPGVLGAALLAVLAVATLAATVGVVRQTPQSRRDHRQVTALVAELERLGVTEFYSEYWSCSKIVFATHERAVCASLGNDMVLAHNRSDPYVRRLAAATSPAYLAPTGGTSGFDEALRGYFTAHGITPEVTETPGFRIYRVPGRTGIPVPGPNR